jgi:hypothetical protein
MNCFPRIALRLESPRKCNTLGSDAVFRSCAEQWSTVGTKNGLKRLKSPQTLYFGVRILDRISEVFSATSAPDK